MDKKDASAFVKKEVMYIVALVALITGFLGGIVFSVYYSGPNSQSTVSSSAPQQGQSPSPPGMTSQQASSILSLEQEVATTDISKYYTEAEKKNAGFVLSEIGLGSGKKNYSFDLTDLEQNGDQIYSVDVTPIRFQTEDNKERFVSCGDARVSEKLNCTLGCVNVGGGGGGGESPVNLFEDKFSSTNPLNDGWNYVCPGGGCGFPQSNNVYTDNSITPLHDGYYMVTTNSAGVIRSIDTTNYQNIKLSYYIRTDSVNSNNEIAVEWRVGNSGSWTELERVPAQVYESNNWFQKNFDLGISAEDEPEIQIRLLLTDGSGDYALWEDIIITGEPI